MEIIQHVFHGTNLLYLFLGTVAGLFLGAMPGLSPTLAVALLIPFTFQMSASSGLSLLGAVYVSTIAGGAISAVLLNIPGAPANIATAFDGHALAKKGKTTQALHYCFISSFIGGISGVLALMFLAPVLAKATLALGPSELFWITLLGITVIGSFGSGSVLKGLFAGCFGVWLSTIGYDPVIGEERFIFSPHLAGGINMIAALIGLFAIPQVIQLLGEKENTTVNQKFTPEGPPLWSSVKATLIRIKALIIGTITGIFVGIIPGIGGQIAGLLAYDQTKKLSSNYDQFGRGEPDGVISAESANSAMVGPSLIPLLIFGIPGSPTAAVLLGGLLIHGLFPGPSLFTTFAETTWTFVGSLMLAQFFMLISGLALSRYSHLLRYLPNRYTAACVTVLAVFGSYCVQNNLSDVVIMITLGLGMYLAMQIGISPAPVVIGLILGPIAETNLLQGRLIASSGQGFFPYFFSGSVNILLFIFCLISIGYSLYRESGNGKKFGSEKTPDIFPRLTACGCVFLGGFLLYLSMTTEKDMVYFFPRIWAALMFFLAVLMFINSFGKTFEKTETPFNWKLMLPALSILVVLTLIIDGLGIYLAGVPAFTLMVNIYSPRKNRWPELLQGFVVAIGFISALYLFFTQVLNVQMPIGSWL